MKDKTSIKAILFDFMGVLLVQKDDYKPDKVVDEIDRIIGKVTNDLFFKTKVKKYYKLDEKEFRKILGKVADKYEKFQPLWMLLPALRKKYKLAIINNGTALTLQDLESRHSIKMNFDLFISSATEGTKKPDPEIYLLTANKLGVKPNECLFIDDSKTNTEGAKRVGMKTIWWKNKQTGFNNLLDFLKKESLPPKR